MHIGLIYSETPLSQGVVGSLANITEVLSFLVHRLNQFCVSERQENSQIKFFPRVNHPTR